MPRLSVITRSVLAVLTVAQAVALPAGAAMRLCQAAVTTTGEDAVELEARRKAMTAWTEAARTAGEGYANWRLATGKSFACAKTAAGSFFCRVAGEPCVIVQNPDTLPKDIPIRPPTYTGPGTRM